MERDPTATAGAQSKHCEKRPVKRPPARCVERPAAALKALRCAIRESIH